MILGSRGSLPTTQIIEQVIVSSGFLARWEVGGRWMAPPETPRSVEMARILLPFARVLRLSELWLGGVSAPRKSILPCFFQCFCCKAQGLNIGAPFINMLFCVVIYLVLCASQDPSENHQNEHNVAFYCVFQCFCAVFWFLYAPGPPELIF